jgi:NAD(P)-dependent dehydrogenase (short-subunit alcohol dehydrogenase family)
MMGILSGKTVIVKGGGRNSGPVIARRFVQEGAAVLICGCREERLRRRKP